MDAKILTAGTTKTSAESIISSMAGMHFPTISPMVNTPRIAMDHQLARMISIVCPMFNNSGFVISIKPKINRVKKGEIPVLPAIVSDKAEDIKAFDIIIFYACSSSKLIGRIFCDTKDAGKKCLVWGE
mmetsp:Transcript_1743/g.3781  ORF Transcript_1743/g.3781 Transcript_1743/m.3781 type:complete len:128 (+) Transcript_1743:1079-1462(+)